MTFLKHTGAVWLAVLYLPSLALPLAAENRIDVIRPDAPELAAYGPHRIGVREILLHHADQPDIARAAKGDTLATIPRADRPLPVEIWYPAAADAEGATVVQTYLRDGHTRIDLHARAMVDAAPETGARYPLVIVSHGYPGNRFLMAPLAENLASKGYVVASIDHTDTTYSTLSSFASALVNRSEDQLFVLDQIARQEADPGSFLHGLVDADTTAIIGYSMGGYGTLISAGAGLTEAAVTAREGMWSAPPGTLDQYRAGSAAFAAQHDPRIKAAIAFAPAGYRVGFFDDETLRGIHIPMLFIGGSRDDTVGYEDGVRPTFEAAVNSDRALLTFLGANHNVGAPMPPPEEAFTFDPELNFNLALHYLDFTWDNTRMNNISAHFATAWLDLYLKHDSDRERFLDLIPNSNDGGWDMQDGKPAADHSYWAGFDRRTAQQLTFERRSAGQ
ncbi:dienelactone hydrolase [Pseudooceanicola sp. CBS1P-1]|uniref:Dienelactone hydrolase n=1 Tax=Pseudooceanicola albus TaxID=2692189 RepID=A0A6L7G635_9RHOB|nr:MULTISPECIES: dienelactone hydrolase [Pseudooceanicola]MBT9386196.1 dienelactone hydrolase [Pseudooceanicola endophyticus]MXN19389.1 dienelactone hydrolase [Pseudooceanicola albus]